MDLYDDDEVFDVPEEELDVDDFDPVEEEEESVDDLEAAAEAVFEAAEAEGDIELTMSTYVGSPSCLISGSGGCIRTWGENIRLYEQGQI